MALRRYPSSFLPRKRPSGQGKGYSSADEEGSDDQRWSSAKDSEGSAGTGTGDASGRMSDDPSDQILALTRHHHAQSI